MYIYVSLLGWLAKFVEEVGCQLVFALLQLLLRDVLLLEDGNVESILLALEEMCVEEVDDFARILPRPSSEDSGTIHGVLSHEVIEERVEVEVGHATHLSLQPTHLKLGLVVHMPDELLTIFQLHLELFFLLTIEIRALLENFKQFNQNGDKDRLTSLKWFW